MIAAPGARRDLQKRIALQRVGEVRVDRENAAIQHAADRIPGGAVGETRCFDRSLRKGIKAGGNQIIGVLIEQLSRIGRRPVAKAVLMLRQSARRSRGAAEMKERKIVLPSAHKSE